MNNIFDTLTWKDAHVFVMELAVFLSLVITLVGIIYHKIRKIFLD